MVEDADNSGRRGMKDADGAEGVDDVGGVAGVSDVGRVTLAELGASSQ